MAAEKSSRLVGARDGSLAAKTIIIPSPEDNYSTLPKREIEDNRYI